MSDQITIFVCNCCGKPAHAVTQPQLVASRPPLIQIECLTEGCRNNYWTYTYRAGDDNAQALDRYTPVTMDESQVGRFIQAAE